MGRFKLESVCTPCRTQHRKCDGERICRSCVLHGRPELCDPNRCASVPVRQHVRRITRQIQPNVENGLLNLPPVVGDENEALLFHHWCIEIAPWFDLFDQGRHFARVVPTMACKSRLLMSAILAYTTRKLYNTKVETNETFHVKYYNESISLLIKELKRGVDDEYSIATAVILCALEVMNASWQNWRRHLNGISSMLEIGGKIASSNLRKASFWIFAREYTQLSILQSTPLNLDPRIWPLEADQERDDCKAEKILCILAMISNYLAGDPDSNVRQQLFDDLSEFQDSLSEKFSAIAIIPGTIPKVLYSSTIQSSMFQMYHLAYILLVGVQDHRAERHAYEIIGIAHGGLEPTARVHAIQPLFYAGQVLRKITERDFIVSYLMDMESELGWTTRSTIDQLQKMWHNNAGCFQAPLQIEFENI